MSMSQEEIEALMNGLDINEDEETTPEVTETVEEDNTTVNMDEIEELIAENSAAEVEEPVAEPEIEVASNVEDTSDSSTSQLLNNSDIDDLLKDLEDDEELSSAPAQTEQNIIEEIDIDDTLANIDGIVETKEEPVAEAQAESATNLDSEAVVKDWTDSKINEGVFPLPAENDTKVVNQLSQVANDSEEKVGQIFDVLSLTLDNNNDIRNRLNEYDNFINSQIKLLNSLNAKFPNIDVFKAHLDAAEDISGNMKELAIGLGEEDMKIFEAMELMQFNDINRQKIERVMSVIRKLSVYLNNLFEDDGSTKEVAVAKHIHGDHNDDLMNDDELDKLIAEFDK